MPHMYDISHQVVLNNRWLFDAMQQQLIDLEGRFGNTTLKPVVARILTLLVRSPRTVVRRRQLFDDGWRAFGFEVCENSLNQVMCALRGTFEKIDPGTQYIKTVPRIGYCLLAEIRPATVQDWPDQSLSSRPGREEKPYVRAEGGMPACLVERSSFDIAMGVEWRCAQRGEVPLSLLMIRIGWFKDCNDLHGHVSEDEAGALIARCIAGHLHRARDRVAWIGEQTFAVLLPDTDAQGASCVAEKIRASVRMAGREHLVAPISDESISLGLACTASHHFESLKVLVGACHATLYEPKTESYNAASYDTPALQAVA